MTGEQNKRIDIFTVAGIAALSYVVTTVAHEGLGHGGMCVAAGGKAVALGAYYFDCDTTGRPEWVARAVSAAGSTINLILAGLFAVLLRTDLGKTGGRGGWTIFLWLMFTINAYTWAGYFLFSGVAGIGDWGEGGVLHGIANPLIWRGFMAVAGAGLYFWLARVSAGFLGRITGRHVGAAKSLSWTAYATGGLLGLLVGLMNPIGIVIVLISSLASSLGGTSGLLWGLRLMKGEPVEADFALPFNIVWLGLGVIAAAAFAVVLGPTLKFV